MNLPFKGDHYAQHNRAVAITLTFRRAARAGFWTPEAEQAAWDHWRRERVGCPYCRRAWVRGEWRDCQADDCPRYVT